MPTPCPPGFYGAPRTVVRVSASMSVSAGNGLGYSISICSGACQAGAPPCLCVNSSSDRANFARVLLPRRLGGVQPTPVVRTHGRASCWPSLAWLNAAVLVSIVRATLARQFPAQPVLVTFSSLPAADTVVVHPQDGMARLQPRFRTASASARPTPSERSMRCVPLMIISDASAAR